MGIIISRMGMPCPKCPYKLGLIKTVVNPCPQCKLNDYQTFEQFQKELAGDTTIFENCKK